MRICDNGRTEIGQRSFLRYCNRMLELRQLTTAALFCAILSPGPAAWCETPISFNSEIRPILSENCFSCHGPDAEDRAADLRLDQREPAVDYGAIVEGEPDESMLVERILSDDPELVMPPPETSKTLTAARKAIARRVDSPRRRV